MEADILKRLNAARLAREAAIVITPLDGGNSVFVSQQDPANSTLDDVLRSATEKAFRSGKSGKVEVDGKTFFLNVHVPAPKMVVIGAVHISQALVSLADLAGFDLTIIDPRTAFATPERFEGVKLHAEWPEEIMDKMSLDAYTALAAVTHDPKIDDFPLLEALNSNCFYVGALGSRKTHVKRCDRLMQAGATEAQLATIKSPIGLDIGASTPQEIAIAIMAEVIEAFRKRDVSHLEGINTGKAGS